jgi:hypothetical protein
MARCRRLSTCGRPCCRTPEPAGNLGVRLYHPCANLGSAPSPASRMATVQWEALAKAGVQVVFDSGGRGGCLRRRGVAGLQLSQLSRSHWPEIRHPHHTSVTA